MLGRIARLRELYKKMMVCFTTGRQDETWQLEGGLSNRDLTQAQSHRKCQEAARQYENRCQFSCLTKTNLKRANLSVTIKTRKSILVINKSLGSTLTNIHAKEPLQSKASKRSTVESPT